MSSGKKRPFFRFGPGALVTAAFIGPGTITTCSLAGAQFGYARIANVITVDLTLLSQMKPGDTLRFKETTLDHARQLLLDRRRLLPGQLHWLLNPHRD
jgi:hypothetical protein